MSGIEHRVRCLMNHRANLPPAQTSQSEVTAALCGIPESLPAEADRQAKVRAAYKPPKWLERVLRDDGPGIRRLLWRLLRNEADVLDAYQDCFCKLATVANGKEIVNARAYAYRTASNIAVEMLRARARRDAHRRVVVIGATEDGQERDTDQVVEPVRGPAGGACGEALGRAIAALPENLRNVVVLRDLSGLCYREISRILGIEHTTARVYRRMAVIRLTELLADVSGHEQV